MHVIDGDHGIIKREFVDCLIGELGVVSGEQHCSAKHLRRPLQPAGCASYQCHRGLQPRRSESPALQSPPRVPVPARRGRPAPRCGGITLLLVQKGFKEVPAVRKTWGPSGPRNARRQRTPKASSTIRRARSRGSMSRTRRQMSSMSQASQPIEFAGVVPHDRADLAGRTMTCSTASYVVSLTVCFALLSVKRWTLRHWYVRSEPSVSSAAMSTPRCAWPGVP